MKIQSAERYNKLCIIAAYGFLAVSIIGSFFVTPIILNQIGDNRYGLYSFCNSITTWMSTISAALGASYIFFKTKSLKLNNDESVVNTIYFKIFALITFAVVLILLTVLPALFFCNVKFADYSVDDSKLIYLLLFISGLNVCITIVTSVFYLFLVSKRRFLFLRVKNICFSLFTYGFNVAFAFLTKSIIAIAVVALVSTLLSSSLNIYCSFKSYKMCFAKNTTLSNNRVLTKQIFNYSLFILINTLIEAVNNNLDKTLLGIFINPESVTFYSLAFSFTTYLTFAICSISETYMPVFHELYSKNDKPGVDALFKKVYSIQIFLTCFFTFGFLACGYEFIEIWLGQKRIEVFFYAIVLILLSLVPLTTICCSHCEKALNKHKFRAITMLVCTCVNVAISIVLMLTLEKSFAIWSCIIGTAISKIIAQWIILPIYDAKVLNMDFKTYFWHLFKYIIIGAISCIAPILFHFFLKSYLNKYLFLIIQGVLFVIVYIISTYFIDKNTLLVIFKNNKDKNKF